MVHATDFFIVILVALLICKCTCTPLPPRLPFKTISDGVEKRPPISSDTSKPEPNLFVSDEEVHAAVQARTLKLQKDALKRNSRAVRHSSSSSQTTDDNVAVGSEWRSVLPKLNLRVDPVINFKLKQRISKFGASITLGLDYLSDMRQWRTRCDVEDTVVRGRFSLRGSELGWAKSWIWNLGLSSDSAAKFKLRLGLNLKTLKAYARLRFRTEAMNPFDLGDGITCTGKVALPALLTVLGSAPLRIEYIVRVDTPHPELAVRRNDRDGTISLSTGIDKVTVSLDELNFCLDWDEHSPLWGIGFARDSRSSSVLRDRSSGTRERISSGTGIASSGKSSSTSRIFGALPNAKGAGGGNGVVSKER